MVVGEALMKIITLPGQGALLLIVVSAVGYRMDLLPFRLALLLLIIGLFVCTLVALAELIILSVNAVNKKPLRLEYLVLAVSCALGPSILLYRVGIDGFRAPMIHDITTDTANPPVFLFTQEGEGFRENSLVYGADKLSAEQITAIQLEAYPDIRTVIVEAPGRRVYQNALFVGSLLGWKISGHDVSMFHFEAKATTPVFGFVDDIVVRITPLNEHSSAIDIRSLSRVGVSDIGANAKRIRLFFDKLGEELIIH